MYRIGVLGDTHGEWRHTIPALAALKADRLLHTGDHYSDAQQMARALKLEVNAVLGNCDFLTSGPKEEILEVAGKRIFLTHGHLYGVKKGLLNLYYRGKEAEAELVVFGHTHAWTLEKMEDILLFNPGSASRPRYNNPTIGLIIINEGKIAVQRIEI